MEKNKNKDMRTGAMPKNSHGRKPTPKRATDDETPSRVNNVRKAYKRPHGLDWQGNFEDEEVEELEDLEELDDIEQNELGEFIDIDDEENE